MVNKLIYICAECGKEFYETRKVFKLNSYTNVCPFCCSTEFTMMESVDIPDENLIKMLIREDDEVTKNIIKEAYCKVLKKFMPVKNTEGDDIGINVDWFEEIFAERERQKEIGNTEFDDSNTANDWCAYICHYVSQGAYNGHGEFTLEGFRTALVKAAALCVAAMQVIDRNKCLPLPEYNLLQMSKISEDCNVQRPNEIPEKRTTCPHVEFRIQHGCTGCAMFRNCGAKDKP